MSEDIFNLSNYDFDLPKELIAQEPLDQRDSSRLLVIDRKDKSFKEKAFNQIIDYLESGDTLVLNDTKVIKARLFAKKLSGAKIEILLVRQVEPGVWEALVNPGRRVRLADKLILENCDVAVEVVDKTPSGARLVKFPFEQVINFLESHGLTPLPQYIKKDVKDPDQYQTVYSQKEGAIAAPTAGFHFTLELLKAIEDKGVKIVHLTLHCGPATFRPVKSEDIRQHKMDLEWIELNKSAADAINKTKADDKKVIAVGTTSVRSLESAAVLDDGGALVKPFFGPTGLYIIPGYQFKMVDRLITNFHTPCSTNLVLVSVFATDQLIKQAYKHAIEKRFRFFSFGDATIII